MDHPVSDELKMLLNRQGMRGATAGTVGPSGKEKAGRTGNARPQVAPAVRYSAGDWMRWANEHLDREEDGADEVHSPSGGEEFRPNALPKLRIIRARPFLAVIEGGRSAH